MKFVIERILTAKRHSKIITFQENKKIINKKVSCRKIICHDDITDHPLGSSSWRKGGISPSKYLTFRSNKSWIRVKNNCVKILRLALSGTGILF